MHMTVTILPARSSWTGGLAQLPLDKEIVLYCKSGIRSAQALTTLKAAGLHNVKHLDGGIAEWTRTIDSSLLVY
ncbi:molybdenum cofactor biosynthesis protein B [Mycobacterium tuberculosis]|uniref:Molybdenum cofactor biosynthesis protein B n=1 Tax=Mycobacterium tuberculosis TaxID=1773 RepID=A0A654T9A4_MYCTX|nr:molybdenum cofactor biosynthesis protein B [Mycobacterium tuberculosis]